MAKTRFKESKFLRRALCRRMGSYASVAATLGFCAAVLIEPAYADYFDTDAVRDNIIWKGYNFVDEVLPYIAVAVGALTTFLLPNGTLLQKGALFAGGSAAVGAAVPTAKYFLGI